MPSLGRRLGPAVAAHRRHGLVRVGHGDDAPRQGDLVTPEAVGIAGAVESLVVLADRVQPVAEPRLEGLGEALAFEGVTLDDVPFTRVELARLVEDGRRDGELPDVVEERAPPQAVGVLGREPQLLGDELGERPNTLRVPASASVVRVERSGEHHDLFRTERVAADGADLLDPLGECTPAPRAERDTEPGRSFVGEDQRQAQQDRERQQATRDTIHAEERDHRRDEDRAEPEDRLDGSRRRGQERSKCDAGRRGRGNGDRHGEHPDDATEHPARRPAVGVRRAGFGRVGTRRGLDSLDGLDGLDGLGRTSCL